MRKRARISDVQALVRGEQSAGECLEDPLFERLAGAVLDLGNPDEVGPADLAALIRQFLVRDWSGDVRPGLQIPATAGWPDVNQWSSAGCSCVPHDVETFWVTPNRWEPDWLEPTDLEAIDAAFREVPRRSREPVEADPIVAAMVPSIQGKYASAGQQEAVRSVFIAPAGATVLACLPTGGGKTLAFQVPALHGIPRGKLVVVIVPTVALARDQERRFRELLVDGGHEALASKPLAYHSGLEDDDRRALFESLRDGSLPIIFTSPEAALGALRRHLLAAARADRLALFAVDEAHMVSQWGDSFRPEFQLVAGLRDELHRAATEAGNEGFPTLLLTATLTSEAFETLRQGFGRGGGFDVVAEAQLRQEPSVVVARTEDAGVRRERILEALPHLPRPLILYTTERAHADDWGRILRERGHRRVEVVKGGDMATSRGEEILDAWTTRGLDIVVATSAFGLGVDQGDVRAIVHACIPESLDRYYQEVGRSGRDGCASVALLVPAPQDWPVAEALASNPSISIERGLERWKAMFDSRPPQDTGNGMVVVPLNALPPGINYSSDLNVAWNQRTLVLMARAGLIRFACVPPPECERGDGESEAEFEARRKRTFQDDALKAALFIEDRSHDAGTRWGECVEPLRRWLRQQDDETTQRMEDLVKKRRPPASLFWNVYTVPEAGIHPPPPGIAPAVVGLRRIRRSLSEELRALLDATATCGRLHVEYSAPTEFLALKKWRTDVAQRTLERLARAGVLEFSIPDDFVDERAVWKALAIRSPFQFVCRVAGTGPDDSQSRSRVTVLGRNPTPAQVKEALDVDREQHVILFPSLAPDPYNSPKRLKDTFASITLGALAGRLTQ